MQRWLATVGLLAVFMLRILIAQGVSKIPGTIFSRQKLRLLF